MNTSGKLRLAGHLQAQEQLRPKASNFFKKLTKLYAQTDPALKEELKKILLGLLKDTDKLAVLLVDLQNDFVLPDFALYAPGGENTLLRNMALLDVLEDLINTHDQLAPQIELITTQDAHVFERDEEHIDAQIMAKGYDKVHATKTLQVERNELEEFNLARAHYGLHCLRGTIGAAISDPIEKRLKKLHAKIRIYRFAKINFSAPEAGMLLKKGIDLSDPRFLKQTNNVYDEGGLTFLQFFQKQKYSKVIITGICGNICVQQAAEGLATAGEKVYVLDPCVHYLIVPGINSYDEVWSRVQQSYAAKGISLIRLDRFRSNPESPL